MEIIDFSEKTKTQTTITVGSYFEIENQPLGRILYGSGLLKFPVYNSYLRTHDGRWFEILSGGIQQAIADSKAKQLESLYQEELGKKKNQEAIEIENSRLDKISRVSQRYQDLHELGCIHLFMLSVIIFFSALIVGLFTEDRILAVAFLATLMGPILFAWSLKSRIKAFKKELDHTLFPKTN